MGKPTKEGDQVKARLVSDFRILNKALKRPNYPLEGSSQLIKQVNPKHKFWVTLDFTSGYHQCTLHEDDRDFFAIILPQGKFRYKVHPQGASSSSDFFLILSDQGLRDRPWLLKNMDDILIGASTIDLLIKRVRYVLGVCRRNNAKLSPRKFTLNNKVAFGGFRISHDVENDLVLVQPSEEKVQAI